MMAILDVVGFFLFLDSYGIKNTTLFNFFK
jgi:hypothetical protein